METKLISVMRVSSVIQIQYKEMENSIISCKNTLTLHTTVNIMKGETQYVDAETH